MSETSTGEMTLEKALEALIEVGEAVDANFAQADEKMTAEVKEP